MEKKALGKLTASRWHALRAGGQGSRRLGSLRSWRGRRIRPRRAWCGRRGRVAPPDGGPPQDVAVEVDQLNLDGPPRERQVEEAVLAAPWACGRRLRGDAATAARDEAREAAERAGPGPELLCVPVAGDEEVQAQAPVETGVPSGVRKAREVREYNAPVGCGGREPGLQPTLLRAVRAPEPPPAVRRGRGAAHGGARSALRVVQLPADVVLRVLGRRLRVVRVGVDDEVLDAEARVRDPAAEVARGHHPVGVREGVRDDLVPAHVEPPAAVVVVPQGADPGLGRERPVD
mmetsp:Transcript_31332/g.99958  ORF Transcript_31332/g.99958 Transcript_31332/m.99958 type:complete len:289 (-) Transcript_31332:573-1439(-)